MRLLYINDGGFHHPARFSQHYSSLSQTLPFLFWVNHFSNYNKVYGSIGTILIIMLLIYINSLLLLIGYELNVSIHSLKAMADERQIAEMKQQTTPVKKLVDNA